MSWLKVAEEQSHGLGGRVMAQGSQLQRVLSVVRGELLAGSWREGWDDGEGWLHAAPLGISATCPFPMEWAGLRDGA